MFSRPITIRSLHLANRTDSRRWSSQSSLQACIFRPSSTYFNAQPSIHNELSSPQLSLFASDFTSCSNQYSLSTDQPSVEPERLSITDRPEPVPRIHASFKGLVSASHRTNHLKPSGWPRRFQLNQCLPLEILHWNETSVRCGKKSFSPAPLACLHYKRCRPGDGELRKVYRKDRLPAAEELCYTEYHVDLAC